MKNDLPVLARKVSKVYGFDVRLIGPYLCKDKRKRVDVRPIDSNSRESPLCKTVQLARLRLEVKIGRPLKSGEDVDHKNHDPTDDSYHNVQLLSHAENSAKISSAGRERIAESSRKPEVRLKNSKARRGQLNPASQFSDASVKTYREQFVSGEVSIQEIMVHSGASNKAVRNMLNGSSYTHVGGPLSTLKSGRKSLKA